MFIYNINKKEMLKHFILQDKLSKLNSIIIENEIKFFYFSIVIEIILLNIFSIYNLALLYKKTSYIKYCKKDFL